MTKFIIESRIEPFNINGVKNENDLPIILFNCILGRIFNKKETLEVMGMIHHKKFSKELLCQLIKPVSLPFGAAFVVFS